MECPLGPGGVQVSTGAGNDKVYSMLLGAGTLPDGAVVVDLGPGNDFFKGDAAGEKVAGGDGNDELNGWGGPDVLDGGAGDDKLDGEKGGDTLLGGDGNDLIDDDHYAEPTADVIDGGPGLDELEAYSPSDSDARNAPAINVTLGGGADDGKPGEGDDVRNVERLDLGSAGTIVADDAANEILLPETGAASTVQALGGNDRVVAGDADLDRIDGGAGDDELIGGFGDDTIVGAPGQDRIRGDRPARCNELHCDYGSGFGADTIDARDGEADSVSCGPGVDTVKADALDVVDTRLRERRPRRRHPRPRRGPRHRRARPRRAVRRDPRRAAPGRAGRQRPHGHRQERRGRHGDGRPGARREDGPAPRRAREARDGEGEGRRRHVEGARAPGPGPRPQGAHRGRLQREGAGHGRGRRGQPLARPAPPRRQALTRRPPPPAAATAAGGGRCGAVPGRSCWRRPAGPAPAETDVAEDRPMIDLTDRVVLVTGANGGIGAATVERLVACGADVVAHDLRAPAGGEHVHGLAADLADPHAARDLWARAWAWRDRIDVLVNCAGIYLPAAVDDDFDEWVASWRRTLDVNLLASAVLCREAIRAFRGARRRDRRQLREPGGAGAATTPSTRATRPPSPPSWP